MPHFDQFNRLRIKTNGVQIHTRTGGQGEPLVLLHGFPQHSLMWHAVAPKLAERFTVIAPDQRGMGGSSIPQSGYDKTTMARDLGGLLDALGHSRVHLAGYDLGAGVAAAFARDYPHRVSRLGVIEFGLAGFGYEQMMTPQKDWTIESNWHLGLFTVPQAAEWLCAGRERELLTWFFHHSSYLGQSAVSSAHFIDYVREVSKPGALRAGIEYYAAVWKDAADNAVLAQKPLGMPVLAVGGEASAGPLMESIWKPVSTNLKVSVIPKAGHWIADENPDALAEALMTFFIE